MKHTYDNRPTSKQQREKSERANRTASIGLLQQWAAAPEQAESKIAEAVRVLLGECSRLADLVPLVETLQLDKAIMGAACNQYRGELARLRGELARLRALLPLDG